jgi:hypothetical protein
MPPARIRWYVLGGIPMRSGFHIGTSSSGNLATRATGFSDSRSPWQRHQPRPRGFRGRRALSPLPSPLHRSTKEASGPYAAGSRTQAGRATPGGARPTGSKRM